MTRTDKAQRNRPVRRRRNPVKPLPGTSPNWIGLALLARLQLPRLPGISLDLPCWAVVRRDGPRRRWTRWIAARIIVGPTRARMLIGHHA